MFSGPENMQHSFSIKRCIPTQERACTVLMGRQRRGPLLAFTLIELLVIVSIMMVLMGLAILPLANMSRAGNLTKTAADIAGIFESARAYAMANNTYVWVGFTETDVSKPVSTTPQSVGTGRVAVAVTASKDGTRGYEISSPGMWPAKCANLVAISALKYFENIHMVAVGVLNGSDSLLSGSGTTGSGNMLRPGITSANSQYVITGNGTASVTNFAWPLGKTLGSGQYNFTTVINFDPNGVARIQTTANRDAIGQYFEIGLQQTSGAVVSPANSNVVALQVECMSGATHIYRP